MARDLNKARMRDTKFLIAVAVLAGIFCRPLFPADGAVHGVMMFLGVALALLCTCGRVYSTAFIGGAKNQQLVTWGPYSLCRNPLYFFSLCGAAGIGLMSGSLTIFVILLGGFLYIYDGLIKREEGFLGEKFGAAFTDFKSSTPRLLPDIRKWKCPDELTFQPKYLNYAVRDAVWWLAPWPVFMLSGWLQAEGIIPQLLPLI